MRDILLKAWEKRGVISTLLLPVAGVYLLLLKKRAKAYDKSVKVFYRPNLPVIVVGNIVVGGVGKTPVVVAIVRRLQQMGFNPGVISRGYGRKGSTPDGVVAVTAASEPETAGDEPVMIAAETRVPVYVAENRPAAMQAVLQKHPDVDVIVSDDGLQHWALQRDIEVIVWDERGRGNGWLLPAGMLREPWPRAAWHPYAERTQPLHLLSSPKALPPKASIDVAWPIQRKLMNHAVQADGTRIKLADLQGKPVRAVAGIAKPEMFFAALRTKGLLLEQAVALPDHADVLAWWQKLTAHDHAQVWLCTQKDAVKLWQINPLALAVPLELELPMGFWNALNEQLKKKLRGK